MKYRKPFLTMALASLLLSQPALAIDPSGWVGPVKIEEIAVQVNGRLYVKIAAPTPDLGCSGNLDGWLEFDKSAPNFAEQYSLLLAAQLADRSVKIYVNSCGWYPYAQHAHLI